VLAVALTVWLIFGLRATDELRFFYPLFVPVVWIALRWGVGGALLAVLAIQVCLVVAVEQQDAVNPLVDIQFLMVTLSTTALMLGAVVTERALALQRMAVQEAEQRTLLSTAPDAVLAVDEGDRILSANPAAQRMLSLDGTDLRRQPLARFLPELDVTPAAGRTSLTGRRSDGTGFPADVAWARLAAPAQPGCMLILRDATDRHAAEAELRERDIALAESMRFAVAGELASALTHELNQPITAVVSYLRAAEIMLEPLTSQDPRLAATLHKASQESIRAADVMRRLRDFYRSGVARREVVSPAEVLTALATDFQDRATRAGVAFSLRIDPALPAILADRTQIEVALQNLLVNAVDAVADRPATERVVELGAERQGERVAIAVEDSGGGVSAEVAPRLFEPFNTTKPEGMGLGLAISRSLLRAQGGDLSHAPGRLGGARFVIHLPIHTGGPVAS
jgi:PAS domain S-box-containing protein